MNNERYKPTKLYRNAGMSMCHLSLVVLLSACGSGQDDPATDIATGSSSVSAAQLAEDGTTSLSVAQATAAGLVPVESVESSTDSDITVDSGVSAAQTGSPDLGAAVDGENVQEETAPVPTASTEASVPVFVTPTVSTVQQQTAEPATVAAEETPAGIEVVEEQPATEPVPVPVAEEEAEPTVAEAQPEPTTALPPPTTDLGAAPAQFTASNTDGFIGQVLDDGVVQIQWQKDPTARGYNVYRQAQYITTVFEEEYIDTDTYDESYYYEIQAFDFEDRFNYIALGLTVEVTGTGRINSETPTPDENILDGYELVFSEEFNGTELDSTKWVTSYLWGDSITINSEEQHYVDIQNEPDFGYDPFSFDGESITITAVETPEHLSGRARNQKYLSGVFTSYDSFKFTYGYVEARAKVPYGQGIWPAFWLLNAYYVDDKPEIDIMEFIGDDQDVVYHTYHYYDSEGNLRSSESVPSIGRDFTNGWHTYAVEWLPGTLHFYVDGILEHTLVDAKISQQDMYIIANLALGGWWADSPDETTNFPAEYKIDYIRAYQKADGQLLSDPTNGQPSELLQWDDVPGASPSHLPPFELWPQGYPERTVVR